MKRITRGWLAAALLAAGCASDPAGTARAPDGESLRFHNWWNYYERGMARLRDDQVAAAREDFERCLDLRAGARFGNPKDALRVRTYGMHALDGYFPNRELGVCLYLGGQAVEAIPYLETSLRQAPSGRARHYLNLARRQQLAAATPGPPRFEVDAASRAVWTRERVREVAGVARGAGRVRDLAINDAPLFIELAEEVQPFRQPVTLREGLNRVKLVARDLVGREVSETLEWRADWRMPSLVITQAAPQGGRWIVEGYAKDDQGLARVEVAGTPQPVAAPDGRAPLRLELRPGGQAVVLLEDLAGHRLRSEISAEALARDWAAAAHGQLVVAGSGAVLPAAAPADAKRPALTLSAEGGEPLVVYHDRCFLDGVARDRGGLRELTVLGEPYLEDAERGCLEKHFSAFIDLEPGTNLVWVTARDLAGNTASQQVTIVRRTADYLNEEYRLTVALPPLAHVGQEAVAFKAHSVLSGQIRRRPVRFRLLERNEGWEAVLQEQQLSRSALADPSVQLRVGKLLAAELVFLGSLVEEGRGLTLRLQVVESGQGEVLFTEDVYSEDAARDLAFQVEGLALKIKQRLPLVDGQVVKVAGGRAHVNVGALRGVSTASRFVVARPPAAGAPAEAALVVRADERFVQLAVAELQADGASALVLPPEAAGRVQAGDLVFAR